MKLLKIDIAIRANGIARDIRVTELQAVEKEKTYTFGHHNRLLKSNLLKPDSMFRNDSPSGLNYWIFCLTEDKQLATDILIELCQYKIELFQSDLNGLIKSLNS